MPSMPYRTRTIALAVALVAALASCGGEKDRRPVITYSGSAVGSQGETVRRQIERFAKMHPEIVVRVQPSPDDATQRHQLFVQWLNAHVGDPDVMELDVIWTSEFAAAGWIRSLEQYSPARSDFFPAAIEANTWDNELYAIPWYVGVGLLYWRTDLLDHAPRSMDELVSQAERAMRAPDGPPYGFVWQGARYEGLITTFVEYLGAFGAEIMNDSGDVVVDSPKAIRALTFMRDEITSSHIAPPEVLTWHEEETRFAFQNGNAVFMRNWPYAYSLLSDSSQSRVAGKFAVATMPAAEGGHPTTALGGAELAINSYSEHPEIAWELVKYLTAPEQQLERAAATGDYPTLRALYDDPRLAKALAVPIDQVRTAIESAVPRPVTPIYTELSGLLQVQLHRALTGQTAPAEALHEAARQMNAVIRESGLDDREAAAGSFAPASPGIPAKAGTHVTRPDMDPRLRGDDGGRLRGDDGGRLRGDDGGRLRGDDGGRLRGDDGEGAPR
jgi:multiple sugar transport system substrate-binding protein